MTRSFLVGRVIPAAVSAMLAVPVWATEPARDFTFRRVAAPEPGATRRITVQIDPAEQAALLAVRPTVPPPLPTDGTPAAAPAAGIGTLAWYWDAVSPALSDASPARLGPAVAALSGAGGTVAAPRLQTLQGIADTHAAAILTTTVGTKVSPALVLAVIAVESGGQPLAVSRAGATGLMQLMPDTAARFGVTDATDPRQNIQGGVAYLDWLMGEFGADPLMVLAGYNAGEGAVRRHGGVPPFAETRDYVPKVLAAWTVARGLCLTPPELLSDGCVFSVRAAAAP